MVGADAHGAVEALALLDEGDEGLGEVLALGGKVLVGLVDVLVEVLATVCEVARVNSEGGFGGKEDRRGLVGFIGRGGVRNEEDDGSKAKWGAYLIFSTASATMLATSGWKCISAQSGIS